MISDDIIHGNDIIYVDNYVDVNNRNDVISFLNEMKKANVWNQRIKINVNCRVCGKRLVVIPSVFKKQKYFYCDEHKTHEGNKGHDSKFYNRVHVNCTNCGKECEVIPAKYKKVNSFGDNHNFCCKECYWEYRKKYYVGEKGVMYHHKHSEESLKKSQQTRAKRKDEKDILNTKIQIKINELLDKLDIKYEREKDFTYYNVDNYLTEYNLIIEVMGDYWHSNPLTYNENGRNMNDIQRRTLTKDKQKRSYIKNHYQIPILNLWERDINENIQLCELIIKEYVKNNGALPNYNSFNYHIKDNMLELNDILITPYQEMKQEDYYNYVYC